MEFITNTPTKEGRNPGNVDVVVPAVGAALWARITSLNGLADNPSHTENAQLEYAANLFQVSVQSPALRQHWDLYSILLLYPVLTAVIVLLRATLYFSTPVDQGFGIVALLSGVEKSGLECLRGASLSGQTTLPVPIRIVVELGSGAGNESTTSRIRYLVGEKGNHGKVRKNIMYE